MKKSPDPKQFLNDADLRLERARNGWIVELSGSYLPEGKTDENKDSKYGTIKWIHLSQEAAIAQLTEIAEMLGLDE